MSKIKDIWAQGCHKITKIVKDTEKPRKQEPEKRKHTGWIFATLTWTTQIFVQVAVMYIVGMFTAMSIVPTLIKTMFIVAIKSGYNMREPLNQIGYWGFPAAFVILVLFFAYVCLMTFLWRGLNKVLGSWRANHRAKIAAKTETK